MECRACGYQEIKCSSLTGRPLYRDKFTKVELDMGNTETHETATNSYSDESKITKVVKNCITTFFVCPECHTVLFMNDK